MYLRDGEKAERESKRNPRPSCGGKHPIAPNVADPADTVHDRYVLLSSRHTGSQPIKRRCTKFGVRGEGETTYRDPDIVLLATVSSEEVEEAVVDRAKTFGTFVSRRVAFSESTTLLSSRGIIWNEKATTHDRPESLSGTPLRRLGQPL